MKRYKRLGGESGVRAYETGRTFIRVRFTDGQVYTYTYKSAGRAAIEDMKRLAETGKGLSTYISRFVREKYASRSG